jgi:aminocarboxymuconate-semialdehyde decarboxylase
VPPLLGTTSFDVAPMRELLAIAAERDLAVLVHPMQRRARSGRRTTWRI